MISSSAIYCCCFVVVVVVDMFELKFAFNISPVILFKHIIIGDIKGVRALRGYFAPPPPPMRPQNEIRFSPNSSYRFIRTMTQVYKSDISLTFTVAMVKMAAKTG